MNPNFCSTCGRPRGIAVRRESFSLQLKTQYTPVVRDGRPAQTLNDLVLSAGVWRNGGGCERTHICDDCVRLGLLRIRAAITEALGEISAVSDMGAEVAAISDTLARAQYDGRQAAWAHNRMQKRLAAVLHYVSQEAPPDVVRDARWEIDKGPIDPTALGA